MLAWLSVWSTVQTCIWSSWCHCHSLSLASVKSRLVLPFWYWLTRVVPDKRPLNRCVCVFQGCFKPLYVAFAVFYCRWVCKHYGSYPPSKQKMRRNLRAARAVLPSGCTMSIYVSYDKHCGQYVVRTTNLDHNHPHSEEFYEMYGTSCRQDESLVLQADGANSRGSTARPKDVYNITQKLNSSG